MESRLKGEKVILRPKQLGDVVNDYRWRRDAELAHLDAAPPLRLSPSEYMACYGAEISNPASGQRFAIDALDGTYIGNCTYYNVDWEKKQAELGILIGNRAYWDKGYGTDAVLTLLGHIFTTTPLERVYLHTLDWNTRAQQCFKKCGFVVCSHHSRGENNFVVMEIRRHWRKGDHHPPAALSPSEQGPEETHRVQAEGW